MQKKKKNHNPSIAKIEKTETTALHHLASMKKSISSYQTDRSKTSDRGKNGSKKRKYHSTHVTTVMPPRQSDLVSLAETKPKP